MAESDLAPTRSTHTARPRTLGDFGFTGTFVSDDTVLAGSLEIKKNKVTLWASGTQLGSWNSADCKVQRMEGSQFSIEADNEMITFTADDPEGLIDAISAYLTSQSVVGDASTGITAAGRAEPVARAPEPAAFTKSDPPAPRDRTAPTVTAGRPEGSMKAPARTEQAPVIRRPRIKAFEARAAEATTTKVDSERANRSDADYPPASAAAPAEAVPAPTVPAEKEPATIADRITATATRTYKASKAHRWLKSDIEAVAIKTGVVASAIGIFTLFALTIFILAGGFRGEPEFVSVPTTTIPPSPTTAVVVTTLPPPPTTLFQTSPAELTDRWNALAEQSRPELVLFTDLTSPFLVSLTPFITLEGLLDPAVGSVVIRATPTGTPDGDGLILTSLGLLIGSSDPSLDGPDRRVLLETLGLAIQDPQLGGLDGTVNYNGLFYHLVYLSDQGVLEFRITPELAPTTTAAP